MNDTSVMGRSSLPFQSCEPIRRLGACRTRDNLRESLQLSIAICVASVDDIADEVHGIFETPPTGRGRCCRRPQRGLTGVSSAPCHTIERRAGGCTGCPCRGLVHEGRWWLFGRVRSGAGWRHGLGVVGLYGQRVREGDENAHIDDVRWQALVLDIALPPRHA